MKCPIHLQAKNNGKQIALISGDLSLSYQELDRWVEGTRHGLIEKGFRPGQVLGSALSNPWEQIVLFFACIREGLTLCPLNLRIPRQKAQELLSQSAGTSTILTPDDLPALIRSNSRSSDCEINPNQAATLLFTSGSSGQPKAALHSYFNHHQNAMGSNQNIALKSGDRWLLTLPLYHVGGLGILFRCFLSGATIVLSSKSLAEDLSDFSVSHVSLVATQLFRIAQTEITEPLRKLRAILLGGSVIPPSLLEIAQNRSWSVFTSYGLTEMSSQVTTTRPGTFISSGNSGWLLPYRELKLSSESEICVRGDTLFQGYMSNGLLRSNVDSEGWFHTRDLGQQGAEGELRVTGRMDHLMISGGENIHPEEVEQALYDSLDIQQALVVPVADPEFGQRPVAFIETQREWRQALGTLKETLEQKLPRYKHPIAYYPWPKDAPVGLKPNRRSFSELAEKMRVSSSDSF